MPALKKENCVRINLNIPDDLLRYIDDYAKKIGASRTVTVNLILRNFVDQQEAIRVGSFLSNIANNEEEFKKILSGVNNEKNM